MPRDEQRYCLDCQKPCGGRRCRRCHGLTRVAYSRANAKAQKMTIIAPESRRQQRGSWWLDKPREDFTAYASVMVVPLEDTKTTYYKLGQVVL